MTPTTQAFVTLLQQEIAELDKIAYPFLYAHFQQIGTSAALEKLITCCLSQQFIPQAALPQMEQEMAMDNFE